MLFYHACEKKTTGRCLSLSLLYYQRIKIKYVPEVITIFHGSFFFPDTILVRVSNTVCLLFLSFKKEQKQNAQREKV